jgi:putative membrane protein
VEKMMHWGNFGGMGFGFGWIFMVLFWMIAIAGITYFTRELFAGSGTNNVRKPAEDLLKKRYAAGEISKNEYRGKQVF